MSRPAPRASLPAEARAVLVKDLRSEVRTRAALATILLFAVVTLITVAFTVPTRVPGLVERGADTINRSYVLSALLWIILFFSAMAGLPRTFVKEEEMRTAPALRLAARPLAVFWGKLLFNALLVTAVAVVVLPLFLILLTPRVESWPAFLAYLLFGSLGMAGGATILGAIVARAGGKAYLMVPLAFPILLPLLVMTINGTAIALNGSTTHPVANPGDQLLPLVSYLVALVTVSVLLFDYVWRDT